MNSGPKVNAFGLKGSTGNSRVDNFLKLPQEKNEKLINEFKAKLKNLIVPQHAMKVIEEEMVLYLLFYFQYDVII
jgi:hypothetical protein